ncbi:MAG: hypothetical protein ACTII7_13520 [Galactobacter sp.]
MKPFQAPPERILAPLPKRLPAELVVAPGSRAAQRDFERGHSVRLGPGVYLPATVWEAATWEQRLVFICAAKVLRGPETVFAGETALVLMGLPTFGTPQGILTVTDSHSRLGREKPTISVSAVAAPTLRDSVRRAPRIFRREVPKLEVQTSGDFLTVDPATAVADAAGRLPLKRGVTAADGLARYGHLISAHLSDAHAAAEVLRYGTHRQRAQQVLSLARPGSGSPFETGSRCVMLQHGFQEPTLQQPHFDEYGNFLGFTDTHWEVPNTSGEADGRIKYRDPRLMNGRTMEDVLFAEKQRQQRIEATGVRIIRWMWEDMIHPERLVRLLTLAKIPRDPRWRVRLV